MNGLRSHSRLEPVPLPRSPRARPGHSGAHVTDAESVYEHALGTAIREQVAQGSRRLLFTSSEPGEGKTTVVADVARALAASSHESVVVVDTDQFRPTLDRHFDLAPGRGLGDVLEEVYLFDLTREDGAQFGVGDWLELLRAQQRSGELRISEGDHVCSIRCSKGAIQSLSGAGTGGEGLLGHALVRSGRITSTQRDHALRIQEETGRPLGEVLRTLGLIGEPELAGALREQSVDRLRSLLRFRQPECRFTELAERHLSASGGRSAAILDTDGIDQWLSRQMHDYLGDPFLAGQVPAYLADTALPNLKVLTAGTQACDLLAPRYHTPFRLLLDRLARTFDIVLLDSTPVSLTTPASRLAALVDGVVLVVKADGAEVRAIRRTLLELRRAGGNVLGAVLSEADVTNDVAISPYYKVLAGYGLPSSGGTEALARRPSFQTS